jgi:hypothetical protein
MLFVVKNRSEFVENSEIHRKNTKQQKEPPSTFGKSEDVSNGNLLFRNKGL